MKLHTPRITGVYNYIFWAGTYVDGIPEDYDRIMAQPQIPYDPYDLSTFMCGGCGLELSRRPNLAGLVT